MQRFILAGLTTLALAATIAPQAHAQAPAAVNPYVVETNTAKQLSPAELVALANQGYFQAQGIPARSGLTSEYNLGRISAKTLVDSAIAANRLPDEAATDAAYLNAVDNQLRVVNINF